MIGVYLLLPIIGVLLIALLRGKMRLARAIPSLITSALLGLSLYLAPSVMGGDVLSLNIGRVGFPGFHLMIDPLSLIMLTAISLLSLAVSIFSVRYTEGCKERFYVLLLLLILGMNLAVTGSDLLSLYAGVEVASLSLYALIAFGSPERELEGSLKCGIMGAIGSLFIILGAGLFFLESGGLGFDEIKESGRGGAGTAIIFGSLLMLSGFSLKSALIPFHSWLPDASLSPAPVSALLSGAFIKVAGAYGMIRLFVFLLPPEVMPRSVSVAMMTLGSISIIGGALLSLPQTDVRRFLSYGSISEMGYIVLGIGTGDPMGIIGAVFHTLTHSLSKGLLFLSSGASEHRGKFEGAAPGRMSLTRISSVMGSLSVSGIPPFAGFWSRLLIIMGALRGGLAFGVAATVGAIIVIAGFLGFLRRMAGERGEAPLPMSIPIFFLALLCLGIGLAYPWVAEAILEPLRGMIR